MYVLDIFYLENAVGKFDDIIGFLSKCFFTLQIVGEIIILISVQSLQSRRIHPATHTRRFFALCVLISVISSFFFLIFYFWFSSQQQAKSHACTQEAMCVTRQIHALTATRTRSNCN